ncbi:MAG: flagellar biosynthetic protein FliO, partial [Burkholderiales bacterium]|nr:flagellar biosynthetic protein FliO [Burkholderiales bacterium]
LSPGMRVYRLLALLLVAGPAFAAGVAKSVATGGLPTGDLTSAAIRMVLGLTVVLGLLGATAWASRRFRSGAQARGGQIEVVSGLSLGGRERVVLLRVGGDQVLVGVSPSGMRPLHVLTQTQNPSGNFSNYMDAKP